MSKLRFKIQDYHAIQSADILIDGITVLSGENGSGKSTISRWIKYLINGLNDYEDYIDIEAKSELYRLLLKIRRIYFENMSHMNMVRGTRLDRITKEEVDSIENLEDYTERYLQVVDELIKVLKESPLKDTAIGLRRIASWLDIDVNEDDGFSGVLEDVKNKLRNEFYKIIHNCANKKRKNDIESLANIIGSFSSKGDEWARQIELYEDTVNLLADNRFRSPMTFRRCIYYGTQRTVDSLDDNSEFERILNKSFGLKADNVLLVQKRIQSIINGNVSYERKDELFSSSMELRYNRNDGLSIPLKQAATGLISFACLERIIENGYITPDTLLIIDEPEAHLHPQWIVEYARTLILLQKSVGIKILISSHNPDMVAAIQSIARKEQLLDITNFYLAQKSDKDNLKYNYKLLGSEIGDIFESFNIALTRIQEYGE